MQVLQLRFASFRMTVFDRLSFAGGKAFGPSFAGVPGFCLSMRCGFPAAL
jgi:hypothetical protein